MAKITYLLGAGASANTIPIVGDMHERMKEVSRYFATIMNKYTIEKDHSKIYEFNQDLYNCLGTLSNINDDLLWLIQEAGNYYTIDTLAKKFYLTSDDTNLKKLKKCLITYFTLEQILSIPTSKKDGYNFTKQSIQDTIDKRYGSFITAITNKRYPIDGGNPDGLAAENLGFEIRRHIKILSWNYDMQFEKSVQFLLTKTIIQHIKNEFQILPNKKSKNEVNNIPIDLDKFAMVKLNGDALWYRNTELIAKNKYAIFDGNNHMNKNEELLVDFLSMYAGSGIEKDSEMEVSSIKSFNFAWEHDNNFIGKYPGHAKNLETAELIASETEILVVIGYSFPIFNREIDSKLFDRMNNLKKIYIQDKNPDRIESTIKNAFKIFGNDPAFWANNAKANISFHKESYTDQFVIPYELI